MLDFRKDAKVPNYLSRSTQRRGWAVVAVLGMVLFLVRYHDQVPSLIDWLNGTPPPVNEEGKIDNRVIAKNQATLPEGVFPVANEEKEPEPLPDRDYYHGVNPLFLAKVKDNMALRGAEHDAFFHLFQVLQLSSAEQLAASKPPEVTYRQLFQQPTAYRGQLVTIQGAIRRVTHIKPVAKNQYGITEYYEIIFQPEDRVDMPLFVYALELPPQFPEEGELREDATVTGFFLKNMLYPAKRDNYSTPLLLAKSFQWAPRAARPKQEVDMSTMIYILIGTLVVGLSVVGIVIVQGRRRPKGFALQYAGVGPGHDKASDRVAQLSTIEVGPDVEESLRQLEISDRESTEGSS